MTLAAAGVTVQAGTATLLHGVDLVLAPGEVVALVGPNGAGKSTLLRVLAGDVHPAVGAVTLEGRPLRSWRARERAMRRAMMGQELSIAFGWRVAEVVVLGRIPQHGGTPGPADHAIADELLEAVDAAHLADRVYATLSGGERQRVQLARALAQVHQPEARTGPWADGPAGPRYLLLDEPTSSLDLRHQHLALRLARRAAVAGTGVLVVLHDLNLAAEHGDRIVLLDRGRVVADGSPADVLLPDLLSRIFEVPMLVVPHPRLAHPLVVPDPSRAR